MDQDRIDATKAMEDAKKAMDKAQAEYDEAKTEYKAKRNSAQAEYDEAKKAFTEDWIKKNPNGSKADLFDYLSKVEALLKLEKNLKDLKEDLKDYSAAFESSKEIYMKLVELCQKTMGRQDSLASDQILKVLETKVVPIINELNLERFELAPSSENTQAVKVEYINHYNNTALTSLPSTITCQFLGIDLPTSQVTCAHIFQKKWGKSKAIIGLTDINHVQNLIILFKPVEIAFDEGRICFLWNNSANQFQMKVLDPAIRNQTVLELTLRQFPTFDTTNLDPIFKKTFGALEGRMLNTGNAIPYKRCFAFHASRARHEAISVKKWISEDDFIVPDEAWSPSILETPKLKSMIEAWLNDL